MEFGKAYTHAFLLMFMAECALLKNGNVLAMGRNLVESLFTYYTEKETKSRTFVTTRVNCKYRIRGGTIHAD